MGGRDARCRRLRGGSRRPVAEPRVTPRGDDSGSVLCFAMPRKCTGPQTRRRYCRADREEREDGNLVAGIADEAGAVKWVTAIQGDRRECVVGRGFGVPALVSPATRGTRRVTRRRRSARAGFAA